MALRGNLWHPLAQQPAQRIYETIVTSLRWSPLSFTNTASLSTNMDKEYVKDMLQGGKAPCDREMPPSKVEAASSWIIASDKPGPRERNMTLLVADFAKVTHLVFEQQPDSPAAPVISRPQSPSSCHTGAESTMEGRGWQYARPSIDERGSS
ncbi:hypothetical protein CC78DRAFT_575712 [Lojkania enalia]|uniref:Uncharacterized protein n=1 Tax=Lojkania enalia TaxID=147567 RepID=A0A9P4KHI3_9PLEO|nr:hypothetical protein CC78DRAFT_575712 [Didymosphaeria enalia]